MNNKVVVRQEKHYGRLAFYPVNDNADLFCELLTRSVSKKVVAKSLMERQLETIKKLGFEVEVVADVVKM